MRGLLRVTWSSTARSPPNPADLLPARSATQRLPRSLKPDEVARAARPDPGLDAARAARPRAVRARLLLRAARRGDRRPRPRLARLRRRDSARRRARAQDAHRARRRAGAARAARAISSAAAPGAGERRRRSRALFLSQDAAAGCRTSDVRRRLRTWVREAAVAGRRVTRTRCGTRSPPTCSRAAPTCARSRSCSDTASISTTQIYTRVESRAAADGVRAEPSRGA